MYVLLSVIDAVKALRKEGFTGDVILIAVFRDALGETYESDPLRGNVQEWARVSDELKESRWYLIPRKGNVISQLLCR